MAMLMNNFFRGGVSEKIGGALGCVDAVFGAVEWPKTTGALHFHFSAFVQPLHRIKWIIPIEDHGGGTPFCDKCGCDRDLNDKFCRGCGRRNADDEQGNSCIECG